METRIDAVYLAQTHVLPPDDPLFKLVGNRPALLKAQVIAPNRGDAPPVTVVLQVGNDSTTLTLDGPARLPSYFESRLGQVEHRYDDSFTTVIPAEWVQPGLSIEVIADNSSVNHDISVGAPTEVKMKMFDVHYFGLGNEDYPAGALDELEAKWPVSDLSIERVRDIDFLEMVIPARPDVGAPYVRVTSMQDYKDQTGLGFDGEQGAALQWVKALSASGGNFDTAMNYINIIGVPAGGQAGGFNGVGAIHLGVLHHELGHALSLPHWGDNDSYPYKGTMHGILAPDIYNETHVGPTWAFDLPWLTFIPPTVQFTEYPWVEGTYKGSPMQSGGIGDQEPEFFFRHFSDYGMNQMQSYLEGKVAVPIDGEHYKWDDGDGNYTKKVTSDGVRYPIEHDVQVISIMAATTLSDMDVNMVYPPIGPYEGNLILTFDPTNASDRSSADSKFCPSDGCDFSLRVVQGGQQKTYMLAASGTEGSPYTANTLKTAAVNLRASDGAVTKVELLLTPNAEKSGLPGNPHVLYAWTGQVDETQPTVAITRDDANPTGAASVDFSVDFSEEVVDVDAGDFALVLNGITANLMTVGDAGDSDASTYTVTVGTITGEGTLGLDIAIGYDITDLSGNWLIPTPTSNEVYTIIDAVAGEGYILSKNADFSTEDTVFTTADRLYMKLWSDRIDFNDIRRNEWELKDADKNRVKQNFTNNFDNTYIAVFNLAGLPSESPDWQWKGKTEDNAGNKFQVTDDITVLPAGSGNPPVADFTGTPTSGTAPLSVSFNDLSTENPTGWLWDFGDGGTSTDPAPVYVFDAAGTFTVSLTAANADGPDTWTKVDYITVNSDDGMTGEGYILSKNADFSTDDRVFSRGDTLYMRLWSDAVDFTDLRRNEWELKDPDKKKVKQAFSNHMDNTYDAVFVLSGLPTAETAWQWKGKVEDNAGNKFQVTDNITTGAY